MLFLFLILALLGFSISLYTYIIEKKITLNPQYKPVCDLSDRISCSKPIKSAYGSLFFVSNSLIGLVFYLLVALLAINDAINLILIAAIGATIASCILAYILYFKIKAICLLCTSLYIVNIILLFSVLTVR
ncbi:MAG TPA: vitamin K epoxide reductase family protein [Candidatus Babeliales bacterium]|nr:vitamin K epoxide reductase family protein [Candidatus Babeliales bacterium]